MTSPGSMIISSAMWTFSHAITTTACLPTHRSTTDTYSLWVHRKCSGEISHLTDKCNRSSFIHFTSAVVTVVFSPLSPPLLVMRWISSKFANYDFQNLSNANEALILWVRRYCTGLGQINDCNNMLFPKVNKISLPTYYSVTHQWAKIMLHIQ